MDRFFPRSRATAVSTYEDTLETWDIASRLTRNQGTNQAESLCCQAFPTKRCRACKTRVGRFRDLQHHACTASEFLPGSRSPAESLLCSLQLAQTNKS